MYSKLALQHKRRLDNHPPGGICCRRRSGCCSRLRSPFRYRCRSRIIRRNLEPLTHATQPRQLFRESHLDDSSCIFVARASGAFRDCALLFSGIRVDCFSSCLSFISPSSSSLQCSTQKGKGRLVQSWSLMVMWISLSRGSKAVC